MIPPLCPVAKIKLYAGDVSSEYNDKLVIVSGYNPDTQFFIIETTFKTENYPVGTELLCTKEELVPQNDICKDLMESLLSLKSIPVELKMTTL